VAEGDAETESSPGPRTGTHGRPGRRTPLILHPILFAAFPVLFLWAHNLDQGVDLDEVIGPLLLAMAAAGALWGLGTWLLHDARRAGLIVSVLALMFFSFGYLDQAIGRAADVNTTLLLAGWILVALVLVAVVAIGGGWVGNVTTGFNIAAVVLVGLNVFTITWASIAPGASNPKFLAEGAATLPPSLLATPPANRPDVYYIIFDEYGGTRALQDFFHYDDQPLMQWLQSKGFVVPAQSATNYPRTELSVASSMNLRYLSFLTRKMGTNTGNEAPITSLLEHSQIGTIMRSLGYDYIHIGSWFNQTRTAANADVNLQARGNSDFSSLLLQQTAVTQASGNSLRIEDYRDTLFQLWALRHLQQYRGPRFVFTHFICPHGPDVFSRTGRYVSRQQIAAEGRATAFIDQHYWIDRQIRGIVTYLQDEPAGQQPVIILQADEGPYPGEPTTWPAENPNPDQLEMKFDILNAYYLPGVPKSVVWPTITPVNTFRMLLDAYFHANLARLPDREYTFASVQHHLYEFHDVTDPVHDAIWGRPEEPRAIPSAAAWNGSS